VGGQEPVTAGTAGRGSRMTAPGVAAWSLGVLIALFFAALVLLAFTAREAGSDISNFAVAPVLALIGLVERVSTGLLATRIGLQPVGQQMLAAADALAP
jgi:hypothetical protein